MKTLGKIEKVCTEVQFQLIKRSGFVNSMTYADTFRKKKDFYGFEMVYPLFQKYGC